MKTEIIEAEGRRSAVVPLKDFEQLKHDAEMLDDTRAYDAAKTRKDEAFPWMWCSSSSINRCAVPSGSL